MATKPIVLRKREVIAKARKAWLAGKLQANREVGTAGTCRYAGPCAIGIALTAAQRRRFDHEGGGIMSLRHIGAVRFSGEWAAELQNAHDNIVCCGAEYIPEFERLLGIKRPAA